MKLSENFTIEELCRTGTGLPNEPGMIERANLKTLAVSLLQPIRERAGTLQVSSGFRCEAVNKAVGGSSSSQHVDGAAADIVPVEADIDEVMEWIVKASGLNFGQCIIEEQKKDGNIIRWIHISLPRSSRPNQVALIFKDGVYTAYKG